MLCYRDISRDRRALTCAEQSRARRRLVASEACPRTESRPMHAVAATLPIILAQDDASGGIAAFLPLIILIAVFYLLLIRPQQKRAKRQRELVASVEPGDRVVTLGGIHGTVRFVDDDTLHLEVAPGTTLTVSKQAVARKEIEDDETGVGDE